MSTDYKKYREELLRSIAERKSYVTYTPFIYVGTRRAGVEMYTAMDYSKEEVFSKIDTDNAVDYIVAKVRELEEYRASHEEADISHWLSCELSVFVDSRVRTQKNYRPNGLLPEDILDGVNCLTVYSPDYEDLKALHRRTFVVDLDDLDNKLWEAGFETNSFADVTSKNAKELLVKGGPDAFPYVTVWKGRELKEASKADKSLT